MFAMRRPGLPLYLILAALFILLPADTFAQQGTPTPVPAQAGVRITSPLPGQALQGSVLITGNTVVEGFQSAELSFSYSNNPLDTWFFIQQYLAPIADSGLVHWDTTTISDGNYTLRLVVTKSDGSLETALIPGLRVRNYTPIETDTPTPVIPTETLPPRATPIPTHTPMPTETAPPSLPTPPPTNPAVLSTQEVYTSLFKGILAAFGLFALAGLYHTARSLFRKG
jgi:hypothetical protein